MWHKHSSGLSFPSYLSDEAAYEILEFFEALSRAFEERYFAQIRRHQRAINPRGSYLCQDPWEGAHVGTTSLANARGVCLLRCLSCGLR